MLSHVSLLEDGADLSVLQFNAPAIGQPRIKGLLSSDYLVIQCCNDTDNVSDFGIYPIKPPKNGGPLDLCRFGSVIRIGNVVQSQVKDGLLFLASKIGVIR